MQVSLTVLLARVYGKKLTNFPRQGVLFQSYIHASFWTSKICSYVGRPGKLDKRIQEILLWFGEQTATL
jgi:hypothetical protein